MCGCCSPGGETRGEDLYRQKKKARPDGLASFNPRRPALPADLSPLSKPRGQAVLPIPYAPSGTPTHGIHQQAAVGRLFLNSSRDPDRVHRPSGRPVTIPFLVRDQNRTRICRLSSLRRNKLFAAMRYGSSTPCFSFQRRMATSGQACAGGLLEYGVMSSRRAPAGPCSWGPAWSVQPGASSLEQAAWNMLLRKLGARHRRGPLALVFWLPFRFHSRRLLSQV